MTEEEVKVEANNGEGAKKLCEAVATKVKALIDSKAGGQLTLEIGEPSCFVNIDGFAGCLKDCGSPIKPGSFEASCQGGKVSGTCGGECGGECVLDAGAQCSGTCDGRWWCHVEGVLHQVGDPVRRRGL